MVLRIPHYKNPLKLVRGNLGPGEPSHLIQDPIFLRLTSSPQLVQLAFKFQPREMKII